jgi:AraC-like DNA-binding protein
MPRSSCRQPGRKARISATWNAIQVDRDRDLGHHPAGFNRTPACRSRFVMIFIPLPFVVALFQLTLLTQMWRRSEHGLRDNPLFGLLIAAYTLQSILIGLRWGYDLRAILPFQSVLACLIAGLAWASFRGLTGEQANSSVAAAWPHLLPAALICLLLIFWPAPIGPLIVIIFLGYGIALLWLARLGPDGLVASRLDGVVRSYRALQITAYAMIGSALMDILIGLDMDWSGGQHAGAVIALGNVLALLILGGAASVASAGTPEDGQAGPDTDVATGGIAPLPAADRGDPQESAEDAAIAASIDALMQTKALYKDVELNLGRIARRLGQPARRVSAAINRCHGMSVSQYVNNYRIKDACRLLADTDLPVTRILFDAGFQTKSNFNREFLRVTGMSPTVWRQQLPSGPRPADSSSRVLQ